MKKRLAVVLLLATASVSRGAPPWRPLPKESAAQRAGRHALVAQRRAGVAVILHRGAADLAIENTLTAYEAAMIFGGDGLEIDLRQTRDGEIVCFHDPWVDRILEAHGPLEDFYYEELLLHEFRDPYGLTPPSVIVPTLHDALALCRRHGALIHLDIKVPGIDGRILEALIAEDMLDHVVTVNRYNSEKILADSRLRLLPSGGGLILGNNDYDRKAVKALAERAKGGKTAIVDDPRAIGTVLERPILRHPSLVLSYPAAVLRQTRSRLLSALLAEHEDSELPRRLAAARLIGTFGPEVGRELIDGWDECPEAARTDVVWAIARCVRSDPKLAKSAGPLLLDLLESEKDPRLLREVVTGCGVCGERRAVDRLVAILGRPPDCASRFAPDAETAPRDAEEIALRAATAGALGQIGSRRRAVKAVLCQTAFHRGLHSDGAWHALDGAEAARALGRLRAREAVDTLAAIVERDDTDLLKSGEKQPHWDFRLASAALEALGRIDNRDARKTLRRILDVERKETEAFWRRLQFKAARALLGRSWGPGRSELLRLAKHPNELVRREVIRRCMERPIRSNRTVLREVAPWAIPWIE